MWSSLAYRGQQPSQENEYKRSSARPNLWMTYQCHFCSTPLALSSLSWWWHYLVAQREKHVGLCAGLIFAFSFSLKNSAGWDMSHVCNVNGMFCMPSHQHHTMLLSAIAKFLVSHMVISFSLARKSWKTTLVFLLVWMAHSVGRCSRCWHCETAWVISLAP